MRIGEKITILPSIELSEMRMSELAGATGVVVGVERKDGHVRGCWVRLPGKWNGERDWYIPYNSISTL